MIFSSVVHDAFILDRKLGVGRPPKGTAHPLMRLYNIDAISHAHNCIDEWRDSLRKGITYLHKETNLLITGDVDDLWVNPQAEFIVVDYKATSKGNEVNRLADGL